MQALSTSTFLFLMFVKFKINLNSDMLLVLQSRVKKILVINKTTLLVIGQLLVNDRL